jgi:hypothetical protein
MDKTLTIIKNWFPILSIADGGIWWLAQLDNRVANIESTLPSFQTSVEDKLDKIIDGIDR